MPENSKFDSNTFSKGDLRVSKKELLLNFQKNNLKKPIIKQKWFKDIVEDDMPEKICFALLDGDLYGSIYVSLEKIFEKLSFNGFILIHDFGRKNLPGVQKAVKDFIKDNSLNLKPKLINKELVLLMKT